MMVVNSVRTALGFTFLPDSHRDDDRVEKFQSRAGFSSNRSRRSENFDRGHHATTVQWREFDGTGTQWHP